MGARILVVDDEPDLLELVRVNLAQAGYAVETASSGSDALAALRRSPPDVMVLDLMLPDLSGTELCARVRADQRLAGLPIIMLTAKSEEIDRVVGLEVGADDYVTKPFSPRELALRVRAVLRRRTPAGDEARALEHGALRVDPDSHRATVEGREITLTAKEFQLLVALMGRPGPGHDPRAPARRGLGLGHHRHLAHDRHPPEAPAREARQRRRPDRDRARRRLPFRGIVRGRSVGRVPTRP